MLLVLEMCGQGVLYVKRLAFQPNCRHPNEATCPLQPFQSDQTAALLSDPFTGYSWQPGYQGEWLTINSLGFRGVEVSLEKPAGTLRLAVVGGSAALGVGVHDDETIEAYLAAELTERLNRPVEVINGAVTSFNSAQELAQILFRIMPLDPDMIIVYDGRNDIYFGLSPEWEPHYSPGLRDFQYHLASPQPRPFRQTPVGHFLLTKTAIGVGLDQLSYFIWGRQSYGDGGELAMHPEAVEIYRRNLERMALIAQAEGVQIVFVLQPSLAAGNKPLTEAEREYIQVAQREGYYDLLATYYPLAASALTQAGQNTGTPAYDFTTLFDAETETMYLDEVHLAPEGNQRVALHLADIIIGLVQN
jgi:lysophospholipase L1-like esterase